MKKLLLFGILFCVGALRLTAATGTSAPQNRLVSFLGRLSLKPSNTQNNDTGVRTLRRKRKDISDSPDSKRASDSRSKKTKKRKRKKRTAKTRTSRKKPKTNMQQHRTKPQPRRKRKKPHSPDTQTEDLGPDTDPEGQAGGLIPDTFPDGQGDVPGNGRTTDQPTVGPTNQPSNPPTSQPTEMPTRSPTQLPMEPPTKSPEDFLWQEGMDSDSDQSNGESNSSHGTDDEIRQYLADIEVLSIRTVHPSMVS